MRLIAPLAAGIWMAVMVGQGLGFLARYVVPFSDTLARLDFTPAYTALMALVILGAVTRRLPGERGEE